jgi:hypothetical protein
MADSTESVLEGTAQKLIEVMNRAIALVESSHKRNEETLDLVQRVVALTETLKGEINQLKDRMAKLEARDVNR